LSDSNIKQFTLEGVNLSPEILHNCQSEIQALLNVLSLDTSIQCTPHLSCNLLRYPQKQPQKSNSYNADCCAQKRNTSHRPPIKEATMSNYCQYYNLQLSPTAMNNVRCYAVYVYTFIFIFFIFILVFKMHASNLHIYILTTNRQYIYICVCMFDGGSPCCSR
jgi:hypothetical protein